MEIKELSMKLLKFMVKLNNKDYYRKELNKLLKIYIQQNFFEECRM